MSSVTVKVRMSAREVYKRFAELPGILSGAKPDNHGLRRYFYAVLTRELLTLIHEAFRVKSLGGSDSLGNSWRALSTKTIRNRLRPNFLARFPLSHKLMILRVSDKLFQSLAPGEIVGDNYKPQANQYFRLTREGLYVGSELHYATTVHKKRPLWPRNMKVWLSYAIDIALGYVLERLANNLAAKK